MKQSKKLALLATAVLAVGLLALAGCAVQGGTNDQAASKSAAEQPAAPNGDNQEATDDVVSMAMVAYANGDQVLFVDQETQTPYIPTEIDDATITYNGQDIDEDDLVAGNIVKVTGNGIMLESYPGQYPGITKVEVVEQGSPADAEQYADIVDTIFAAPDQSQVPAGNLEYKTADAQVSVALEPYEFDWEWKTDDGNTSTSDVEGFAADGNGVIAETIVDARIAEPTEAFAAFSVNPTSVEIERTPLAKGGKPAINPQVEDETVPCTVGEDGAVSLTIEPGFLYELKATFPQGEAEYAFYTVS